MEQILWSPEEVQAHIDEIILGERIIDLSNSLSDPSDYVLFKYPTKKLLRLAQIESEKYTRRGIQLGLFTEEETLKLLKDRGIWTVEHEELIKEKREKLDQWNKKLKNPDLRESSRNSLEQIIKKLELDLWQVEKRKEEVLINTVERKARQAKYDFLVWNSSFYFEAGEPRWNYLTYSQGIEDQVKAKLFGEFIRFLTGHSISEIRYLARNQLWRIHFICSKESNLPIFSRESIGDLTPDQLNLIWWSHYYDSIWKMLPEDQPADWIIDNDDELDKYMEDLHKERSKELASKRAERQYGPSTAMNMNEVIVTSAHPDYERLDYDKPPDTKGKSDNTLRNDPRMEGERHKRVKKIKKSRKFTRNKQG